MDRGPTQPQRVERRKIAVDQCQERASTADLKVQLRPHMGTVRELTLPAAGGRRAWVGRHVLTLRTRFVSSRSSLRAHDSSFRRGLNPSVVRRFRWGRHLRVLAETHPVLTKQFDRMQGRHAAVAADPGVSRTVPVAAPADALRVGWVQRKPLAHRPAAGRSWASDLSN